ncbi:MAG: GLPGLI family protein [Ekhidna sp.]|uniref:GLPGLI family protein n=1 Tax=Ekhidna sp. TaxID=2608089 RepID=UPI0032EC4E84
MRKTLLILSLVQGMLVGITYRAIGQKFEGIASYKSSMNIESVNIAGQDMSPEMQESLRKQIAQQMQRDYTLTFNLQEAIWKEDAALEPESPPSSNGGMQIRLSTGNSKSYVNPGKNEFLEETEIFGKKFLIADELEPFNWKITGEKKKIGDYTVIKAEFLDINEQTTISLDNSEQKTETMMDTTLITAWYTPEIPVSQGPANTWGLPGLILELKQGNLTFLCTKVELNPATPVTIEKPEKGKRVSREEADKIRDEKMQEMMKKYDTGGEDGHTRTIRIGG